MTSPISLSTFSSDLGCQVLNPDAFKPEVINAFHPAYVKTYMPEFLTKMRTESFQYSNGVVNGGKSKAKRESVHGKNVNSISVFPKTQRVNLDVKQFFTYAKAGMPKGVK